MQPANSPSTAPDTGLWWEDMMAGAVKRTRRRTVTETDLVTFANLAWMTEELFTVTEGREAMTIPGRVVPGALVYAFAEGLMMPTIQATGLAFLAAALDVRRPTFVGDTIHVQWEVVERRPTSRGGRGLVRTRNTVVNQRGEAVLVYEPLRLIRRRGTSTES